MANRGTLFLDEVGDIPLETQPKLLRALQEKSFERLGGTKTIPIDVRLVAATNRNLTQMMGDKLFRSDLYYRLKVFPITTPPLRDHAEDIPLLARHFTRKYAMRMSRQIDKIPSDTMKALVGLALAGECAGAGEFHREVGDSDQRFKFAGAGGRDPVRMRYRRRATLLWISWSGSILCGFCGNRGRGDHGGDTAGPAPDHAERDDAEAGDFPGGYLTESVAPRPIPRPRLHTVMLTRHRSESEY